MIVIAKDLKTKEAPSLPYLNCLALKSIFDNSHMTLEEQRLLGNGIEAWVKKIDMSAYEKKELQNIVNCLLHDKEGRFDSEKFAYKKADVDYKKVYSEGI